MFNAPYPTGASLEMTILESGEAASFKLLIDSAISFMHNSVSSLFRKLLIPVCIIKSYASFTSCVYFLMSWIMSRSRWTYVCVAFPSCGTCICPTMESPNKQTLGFLWFADLPLSIWFLSDLISSVVIGDVSFSCVFWLIFSIFRGLFVASVAMFA